MFCLNRNGPRGAGAVLSWAALPYEKERLGQLLFNPLYADYMGFASTGQRAKAALS